MKTENRKTNGPRKFILNLPHILHFTGSKRHVNFEKLSLSHTSIDIKNKTKTISSK